MPICVIEDCGSPSRRNKMCTKHATRVYRYGSPHICNNEFHGMSKTPIYNVWCHMISRCHNPNNRNYRNYGYRDITVCGKWKNSFIAFYKDMRDIPFEGAELERINNDKGYYKGNCKWATHLENSNNRDYSAEGVWFVSKLNKWQSEIRYYGKRHYLGVFENKALAMAAYRKKAFELGKVVNSG